MKRKKGFIHEKTRMSTKLRQLNTASFLRVPSWIDIFFVFISAFICIAIRQHFLFGKKILTAD